MDTTNGICQLCGERLTKAGMSRHLSACLPKHDADGRKSQLSRIRIDDETGWFWIDVEMKASDSLATLNAFLRDFWLECCGHLSSFAIGRKEYTTVMWGEPLMQGEYDMAAAKLKNVLSKGTTFYPRMTSGRPPCCGCASWMSGRGTLETTRCGCSAGTSLPS